MISSQWKYLWLSVLIHILIICWMVKFLDFWGKCWVAVSQNLLSSLSLEDIFSKPLLLFSQSLRCICLSCLFFKIWFIIAICRMSLTMLTKWGMQFNTCKSNNEKNKEPATMTLNKIKKKCIFYSNWYTSIPLLYSLYFFYFIVYTIMTILNSLNCRLCHFYLNSSFFFF